MTEEENGLEVNERVTEVRNEVKKDEGLDRLLLYLMTRGREGDDRKRNGWNLSTWLVSKGNVCDRYDLELAPSPVTDGSGVPHLEVIDKRRSIGMEDSQPLMRIKRKR